MAIGWNLLQAKRNDWSIVDFFEKNVKMSPNKKMIIFVNNDGGHDSMTFKEVQFKIKQEKTEVV